MTGGSTIQCQNRNLREVSGLFNVETGEMVGNGAKAIVYALGSFELKLLASLKQTDGPTFRIIEHVRLIESHRYIDHLSHMSNLLISFTHSQDDQTAWYRQVPQSLLQDPPPRCVTTPVEWVCHAPTRGKSPVLLRHITRETNQP